MMAAFYGLRRSEAIGMNWDAFNFKENTFTIKHTLTVCMVGGQENACCL